MTPFGCLHESPLIIFDLRQYEDSRRQEAARKTVPLEELEEKAVVSLAKLLSWFKQSFSWRHQQIKNLITRMANKRGTGS